MNDAPDAARRCTDAAGVQAMLGELEAIGYFETDGRDADYVKVLIIIKIELTQVSLYLQSLNKAKLNLTAKYLTRIYIN